MLIWLGAGTARPRFWASCGQRVIILKQSDGAEVKALGSSPLQRTPARWRRLYRGDVELAAKLRYAGYSLKL